MKYKFALISALLICAGCADFGAGGGSVDPEIGVNAYLSTFNPALVIQVSPSNGGKVSASPSPPNSDGTYRYGDIVTVKAVPNNGYVFDTWSDGVKSPVRDIVMSKNETLTAYFKP